ncbi:hypothetical protein IT407_00935 [Candidatus Uhrbacteria bacterium]|nr:hypothetical protein [Candidatus Uhrbacteria bacterium]
MENAFRQKHDPSGLNIERLPDGAEGVEALLSGAGTASLFSPKRFLRVTGLLSSCPKSKEKALLKLLSTATDDLIVVDYEEDAVPDKLLKSYKETPKFTYNPYPLLSGLEYRTHLTKIAHGFGLTDEAMIKKLADMTEGDFWLARSELTKLAAGGTSQDWVIDTEISIYDRADAFLRQDVSRYRELLDLETSLPMMTMQQALSFLRVRDQDLSGIPPFVASKMKRIKSQAVELVWESAFSSVVMQRSGFADPDEALALLI